MAAPAASPGVTSKKPSLLNLCPELLNRIYLYVLTVPHPLSLRRHGSRFTPYYPPFFRGAKKKRTTIGLLLCCRSTRTEGTPIYYGCNTFEISEAPDLLRFYDSQARGSTRCSLIKNIVIKERHMNRARAKELRHFPNLESVSVVHHAGSPDFDCSLQGTDHPHFITEAEAKAILNDYPSEPYGRRDPKVREGFLAILKRRRSKVACVLITSVDRNQHRQLLRGWNDHTFFNLSLDDADNRKLSVTEFKRSTLHSEAEQFSDLCR